MEKQTEAQTDVNVGINTKIGKCVCSLKISNIKKELTDTLNLWLGINQQIPQRSSPH